MSQDITDALHRAAAYARAESAAVAAKLAAVAEVARLRREADGRDQVPVGRQAEFVAAEVATALSVSTLAAHGLIDLGETLDTRLPETRRALERGELDLTRVRVIVDRTAAISDLGVLAEVERRALAVVLVPGRCVTRGQVARVTDRVIAAVDPDLVIAQRKRADADRDVVVRADADGMCSLWGALPGVGGVAVDDRLRVLALGVCAEDPRTLAQRRADALVAMAHGDTYLACECGSPVCPSSATETDHHRCRPVIQVVVPVETLLGVADLPGVLTQYGIVDPQLVRTLAADARWQRLLTHDGIPIVTEDGGASRYAPSRTLAGLVRARDGHCRFPGCTTPAPSCDLDHVRPFDHGVPTRGGLTTAANLACLCRWHHRLKTEGHWQVSMTPDATQRWTGPTGQKLSSTPNGLAAPARPVDQRQREPVLRTPRSTVDLPCPHPDLPPDDHPPSRFNTHGCWTGDPWTDRDYATALDQLDQLAHEINTADRRIRRATPARQMSGPTVRTGPTTVIDLDETPPF